MKNRYKVIKKEELKKNDYVSKLCLYVSDEELSECHLIYVTESLQSRKYIDGKVENPYINRFDVAEALVDYDIRFYNLLDESFITSKLNKIVIKKNLGTTLKKPIYESLAKEELAYTKEENRASKELIKYCRR